MEYVLDELVMHFNKIIKLLAPSMDDYLYVFDLKNGCYYISENAVNRFKLPSNAVENAFVNLRQVVYPEDWDMLIEDFDHIKSDSSYNFHNLQYRWLGRDDKPIWINCRGRVLRDDDGNAEVVIGCINEIGLRQKADNISGLMSESSFENDIRKSGMQSGGFALRLGIDCFKEINENRGVEYGDMILAETAECIQKAILKDQRLYKLNADEFLVADFSGRSVDTAMEIYDRVRERINFFISNNQYEVFYTISGGIISLSEYDEYHDIMKYSEFALNEAKNQGRNKCYVFEEKDYEAFSKKRRLIRKMRKAINDDFKGFETYFQPIVDIDNGELSGAETLLRFNSEETGMVPPSYFIPLLEESGLIIPVGRFVLDKAIEACRCIQKICPGFHISYNLSYVQVLKGNALSEIIDTIEDSGLAPGSIVVELTESGFLESDDNFIAFCSSLRSNGVPIALDDFGTGYSNFHYLYNLNPSTIKIDRTFTLKALKSDYEYNLLSYMADMTHSIGCKFCIEGIETKDELERISHIQPDYIQGYYYGRPCPIDEFIEQYVNKATA